jgi:hypothetical protein
VFWWIGAVNAERQMAAGTDPERVPKHSSTVASGFINSGDVGDDQAALPSASNHHERETE